MAGPGNTLGADHAFANSAELRHRRLGTPIAGIDAKLDSAKAARECSINHELLDHSVKAGAALLRHNVGIPDLKDATTLVDRDIGAHPEKLITLAHSARPPALSGKESLEVLGELPRY